MNAKETHLYIITFLQWEKGTLAKEQTGYRFQL